LPQAEPAIDARGFLISRTALAARGGMSMETRMRSALFAGVMLLAAAVPSVAGSPGPQNPQPQSLGVLGGAFMSPDLQAPTLGWPTCGGPAERACSPKVFD
jgi:hypothetical protein